MNEGFDKLWAGAKSGLFIFYLELINYCKMKKIIYYVQNIVHLGVQIFVMKTATISQLRSNIKKYLDEVTESDDILIIPRTSDDDAVVILSMKEYNAMQETGYLLSSQSNRRRLQESIQQLEKRQVKKLKLKDL